MRKALLAGIGGIVILAAVLVIFWYPTSEEPERVLEPPTSAVQPDQLPPLPSPPLPQTVPPPLEDPEPLPGQEQSSEPSSDEVAGQPDGPEEDQPQESDAEVPHLDNISMTFFDDLAQQIVAAYHPAASELNPAPQGRLDIHFTALNRRYGVEMIGLDHQSPSVVQARQEIFNNLLQPDTVEALWTLFHSPFEQSLDETLRAETWTFPAADNTPVRRELTIEEQWDFYQRLSAAIAALAQSIQQYAQHADAPRLTEEWLQSQTTAFAAHSRYQQAETALETALQETPQDQIRILDERLERDAAAQGIMQAIAARERARENLLAVFQAGPSSPDLSEAELIYLSEWLLRRIHSQPGRTEVFLLLADKLRELSLRLDPGS